MKKKILIIFAIVLVAIQFVRPQKNVSTEQTNINQIPENVLKDLKVACYDCHSNNTVYPWYSNIQPVAWWLNRHIENGKRRLNFDETLSSKDYEEIIEVIEENEMPLFSYTLIHRDAKLDDAQQKSIIDWASQAKTTAPEGAQHDHSEHEH